MVFQKERKVEKKVLVCICFKTRKLDWMLMMNLGICLWK